MALADAKFIAGRSGDEKGNFSNVPMSADVRVGSNKRHRVHLRRLRDPRRRANAAPQARNRDQQPELQLVDQPFEQSAGEQRPLLEQAQTAAEQPRRPGTVLSADRLMKTAGAPAPAAARLGPASPNAVRDRYRANPPPPTRAAPARGP